jgi:septum site-determining protein MinD
MKKEVVGVIPQDDNTAGACLQRSVPIVVAAQKTPIAAGHHEVVRKLSGGILQRAKQLKKPKKLKKSDAGSSSSSGGSKSTGNNILNVVKELDARTQLKLVTHKQLIKAMNLKNDDITKAKNDPTIEEKLRNDVRMQISKIVDSESPGMQASERRQVIQEILDEALGLGPLEDLLADDGVSEIMVNGHEKIFYEKNGRINLSKIKFTSNVQLRNVIERIVTPLGRRIDEKTPYVDARLADGSRVNAIIEPLSIDGPALTIRKFRKDEFGVDQYIHYNSASKSMMDFLRICCENGLNVVISGGTGSGKTTLLNCLSSFIPSSERIITVEDAAELQLRQEHVVRLETRPANMEGTGAVSIRDLIKNSLRMRPDRIVVGECRDGAALDMLAAMNTGHDGSMTTVHSNNPRESIGRLINLCMQAGISLPEYAIKEQIASAVDLVVQISRLSDGSRRLISITEVQGMQGETVTLQEVFRFVEKGFDKNRKIVGEFQATGLIPKFIEKFEAKGIIIPKTLFSNEKPVAGQATKKRPGPGVPRRPTNGQQQKPRPAAPNAQKPTQTVKKAGGQ